MCTQQHNIYRKVRSALSYLMWAELLWADIQLDITLEIMERCKHLDCLHITLVDTLLSHTIYQTEMGRRG